MLRLAVRARHAALALCLAAWGLAWPAAAHAQPKESRREYFTPGLAVETGARRGACDVLTFTADGKHLLAVGDDKLVRIWKFSPAKGLEAEEPLRWRTWHEARGNIYAMALSPDANNRRVAIAGQGMTDGSVAVLDRLDKGKIRHSFTGTDTTRSPTIWAMGFAPNGRQLAYGAQDGSVWAWDLHEGKETEPWLLGGRKVGHVNYVRLVGYLDPGHVVSVDSSARVLLWPVGAPGTEVKPKPLVALKTPAVYRAALSPNRKWLAVASAAAKHRYVELRPLPDAEGNVTGGAPRFLFLPPGEFPQSIGFSQDGKSLAVGARLVPQPPAERPNETGGRGVSSFYKEGGGKVYVCDLTRDRPMLVEVARCSNAPEGVALDPGGVHVAVAGGDDHELAVWNLRTGARVGEEVVGPGRGLWSVALSPDARFLGFKDRRNADPQTPNDRGAGPWRVFDLQLRKWAPPGALKAVEAPAEEGGWKLHTSLAAGTAVENLTAKQVDEDRQNAYVWFVESPKGKIYKIPLDTDRDWLPRCYAFLPAVPRKGDVAAQPVRLAVGHLWGVSVFDLTGTGPKLRRYMAGHEGEVMGLAVSADQQRLVTVSRDETVAGWTLADWPSHPELGARFFVRQGRLFVDAVDGGGPAWEAGLSKGDEIVLVVIDRKKMVYNASGKYNKTKKLIGSAAAAQEAVEAAEGGKEIYFGWKRPGDDRLVENLTTLRQRPLWRFFPTREQAGADWVLWRWRDYYYDTSTNGDSLIGWQRNYDDPYRSPTFYKAEQFRKEFHKPERLKALLVNWKTDAHRAAFLDMEAPKVELTASAKVVKDLDLEVTLRAAPSGSGENHKLARVLLWVNDYQFKEWTPKQLKLAANGSFAAKVTIPRSVLRRGKNLLLLQCYNRADVRGEIEPPVGVEYDRPPVDPALYGIFVGVSNYRKASPRLASLHAAEDARAMFKLWQRRAGSMYKTIHLAPPLLDGRATREKVLEQFKNLEGRVKPDDRLVFHLGGHGTRPDELEQLLKLAPGALKGMGQFLYCCTDFDVKRLRDTTISFEELYEMFVRLPCHKILLLDACHAGGTRLGVEEVSSNPLRLLTKDGVGPVILAACRPDENAYEEGTIDLGRTFGLFSAAVRQTLEERFDRYDADKDGALEPGELFAGVSTQLQTMMRQLRSDGLLTSEQRQTPDRFLPSFGKDLHLVRRPVRR